MQNTLTELQALQLQVKQAHWNVSGTLFYTLHELLQEHYEGISKYADDVAERMLAVGASERRAGHHHRCQLAPARDSRRLHGRQPRSFSSSPTSTRRWASACFSASADVEKVDPTTANLLQEVEGAIEKYQWQMRAFLQNTPRDPNTGFNINNGQPVPLRGK